MVIRPEAEADLLDAMSWYALLRRFPYGIYYFQEAEAAAVIAVFHAKRDPKRWQKRR